MKVFSFAFIKRFDHMPLGKEGVCVTYLSPSLSTGGCQGRNLEARTEAATTEGCCCCLAPSGLFSLHFYAPQDLSGLGSPHQSSISCLQGHYAGIFSFKVNLFKDDPSLYHIDIKLRITVSMDSESLM